MKELEEGGFKIEQLPKTATQQGNIRITNPAQPGVKLNLRLETHPLTRGGKPVPHVNVELVTPRTAAQPKTVTNTHITK